MIDQKIIVSIITARSGSKRIPNKNLRKFNGVSLIGWTAKAASYSKYIDYSYISTDSKDYGDEAKKYGSDLILRPKDLSTDYSSSADAIIHAYKELSSKINIKYVVLLQPTSPLREKGLIDRGIELLNKEKKADTLVEVCHLRHFTYTKKGRYAYPDYPEEIRSQDLPEKLVPSGRLYIYDIEKIKNKNFDFNKSLVLPMIGPDIEENINIDHEIDFKKLKFVYDLDNKKYLK